LYDYRDGVARVKAYLQRDEGWMPSRRVFRYVLGDESWEIGLNWPTGGVQFVYKPQAALVVGMLIETCANAIRGHTK